MSTLLTSLPWLKDFIIATAYILLGLGLGFLAHGITRLVLHALKFDQALRTLGAERLFGQLSVTSIIADLVEFIVILVFFIEAFYQLRLDVVAVTLLQLLQWIPQLIAAFIIFTIFYILAVYAQRKLEESRLPSATLLAHTAYVGLILFGTILGLRQAGFNTAFLEQAILILLFAISLAFALTLGISLGFAVKDDVQAYVHEHVLGKHETRTAAKKSSRRGRKKK